MSRRLLIVVLAVALSSPVALFLPGTATAAAPAATVSVADPGRLGRFETAILTVTQTCRTGATPAELVVDVTQSGAGGSRAGTFGARCDGKPHALEVELAADAVGAGEFHAGAATVSVRFTVLDRATMDPLPQATTTRRVTLLPQSEVEVGQEAEVGRFNTVIVPVNYRCQRPWLVSELDVHADQGAVHGFRFLTAGLRCDGRWHHLDVSVPSDDGAEFVRGYADLDARLTIQDPIDFDPVDQSYDARRTWVSPAAAMVLDSAQRTGATVRVTMSARCHRPWVVQDWGTQVTQRDGRVIGSSYRSTGLTCDDAWHKLTLTVSGTAPFTKGPAVVSVSLSVLDPVDFDPVGAGGEQRTVTLK